MERSLARGEAAQIRHPYPLYLLVLGLEDPQLIGKPLRDFLSTKVDNLEYVYSNYNAMSREFVNDNILGCESTKLRDQRGEARGSARLNEHRVERKI